MQSSHLTLGTNDMNKLLEQSYAIDIDSNSTDFGLLSQGNLINETTSVEKATAEFNSR